MFVDVLTIPCEFGCVELFGVGFLLPAWLWLLIQQFTFRWMDSFSFVFIGLI